MSVLVSNMYFKQLSNVSYFKTSINKFLNDVVLKNRAIRHLIGPYKEYEMSKIKKKFDSIKLLKLIERNNMHIQLIFSREITLYV